MISQVVIERLMESCDQGSQLSCFDLIPRPMRKVRSGQTITHTCMHERRTLRFFKYRAAFCPQSIHLDHRHHLLMPFDASLLTFEPLRKGGSFFALSTGLPRVAPF